MVVITMTASLTFALVVFPALCYCVNAHGTDVGSVPVLLQGRWSDFWGLKRKFSSTRGEGHGLYVKVSAESPHGLDQIIELTGLEAIDSEARAAAENEESVLGPAALHSGSASSTSDVQGVECDERSRGGWDGRKLGDLIPSEESGMETGNEAG
jgi:hypothetical protein